MDTITSTAAAPTHTELKTRLDELRVRLHLGGMEAHDAFEKLSHDLSAFAHDVKRASKDAAHALAERIRDLEAALIIRD